MSDHFETLTIDKDESLSSIEQKTALLLSDKQFKVRFPAKLNTRGALGIEVALIQLIGTWLKLNKHKKVFHSYQTGKPESFKDLCSSIYGIAALSMIDEIWDEKKVHLPKGLVLSEAKNIIESLRTGNIKNCFSPRYFGIPYIKTNRYDKEFDMPLYNGEEIIKSEAFFRYIEEVLKVNIEFRTRFESLKKMIEIEDLSDLLWEVFKNTHDHGRQDTLGNINPENFRAIIIQHQDITNDYLNQWCGTSPSLAQIQFRNNWFQTSNKFFILDLSVVDFGAGFVDLAKQKANMENNLEVFLQCLQQGWSRLEGKSRGSGLTKVLNCIHKYKGWIRVRTSNLLLEKTFSDEDLPEIKTEDIQVLKHQVVGTSIHISIPIPRYESI
jgi:hypothetical protein